MGEVWIEGPQAEAFLNHLLTNDLRKLAPGQGQYTLMCNEQGGVIDDLYAYRLGPDEYLLIINASRIPNDAAWLQQQLSRFGPRAGVRLQDASEATGALAVQGPRVAAFINLCFPGPFTGGAAVGVPTDLKKNQAARTRFAGRQVWVSRTGYTGEDGFEIVAPGEVIEGLWNRLLELGRAHGLKPAGLGARDTLRTEVCYPLYGHELNETTTPLDAGLGFFVALAKGEFIGRAVLAEQKLKGVSRKLVAFKMAGKSAAAPPRLPDLEPGRGRGENWLGGQRHPKPVPGHRPGHGLPAVPIRPAQTPLAIEIRGQRAAALVVSKPFYRKPD